MTSDGRDAASNLCRSCGLCCDGTLFDYVPITRDESARLLHRLPVVRSTGERGLHVEQRCVALGVRGCDVYASRPSACARFRCRLLRRVEAGEASLAEAEVVLQEVFEVVSRLDRVLPPGRSLRARRHALAEIASTEAGSPIAEAAAAHDAALVDFAALLELARRELSDEASTPPAPEAGRDAPP